MDNAGAENDSNALKVNKANILEKATEYIKYLEESNRRLQMQLHHALQLSGTETQRTPVAQQTSFADYSVEAPLYTRERHRGSQAYTIRNLSPNDVARPFKSQ